MNKPWQSFWITLVLVVIMWLAPTSTFAQTGDPEQAETAIEQVLSKQVMAWNKGDLAGFMAGYLPSEKLTFFSGTSITSGWQATLDRYRQRYQAEGREMGKLTFKDLQIEMLGAEGAFVRGKWHLEMSNKEEKGGLFTLIFKKTSTGWHIIHDHTS